MAAATDQVPFSVNGKTAIITGAGSGECVELATTVLLLTIIAGINYCFAKLLLSRNCNVVIGDLGLRPEAQKLVEEYDGKDGKPRCIFVKTDVVQWPDLDNMFQTADEEFGGADIVCPGAGVFEPHWSNFWHPPGTSKSKDSAKPEGGLGHYALYDINLTHPTRCTQLAMSRWLNTAKDSKVGKVSPTNPKRVVHISSVGGQAPSFSTPLYMASKHALNGLIRSLAGLDILGIRVNGVAPGMIRTPLWTEHPEKMLMIDEERDAWVEPEEVAEAMLRCCEDDTVVGGYIMEVLKDKTRNVDWRNDPGPQGPGADCSNRSNTVAEAYRWLGEPNWGVPSK